MKSYFKRMTPGSIKTRMYQSRYYNRILSRIYARSSKRLDLCAAQIALVLHLAGSPLVRDRVCLEIGSGWTLSYALIFHLLGAKKVIATDISPLAQPSSLSDAIHKAVPYIVRDTLSPFCDHSEIRARLDNLLSINRFTFDVLNRIGIEYIAPIDLARNRLNIPTDLVYSGSVLEYVPVDDISPLLANVVSDLRRGGIMIHCIHLEDHRDILNHPFAFYSESEESFSRNARGARVNRIRRSQWREFFNNVKDLDYRFIYEWSRRDKDLPTVIDPSISHEGEDDLRISHVGVLGIKR